MGDDSNAEDSGMGDAPESAVGGEKGKDILRRCEAERDTMSAKETSDCAGAEIAGAFENEEDGGS